MRGCARSTPGCRHSSSPNSISSRSAPRASRWTGRCARSRSKRSPSRERSSGCAELDSLRLEPERPFLDEALHRSRPARGCLRRGRRPRPDRPVLAPARRRARPRPAAHCRGVPRLRPAGRLQGGDRLPHRGSRRRPLPPRDRDACARRGPGVAPRVPSLLVRHQAVQRPDADSLPPGRSRSGPTRSGYRSER